MAISPRDQWVNNNMASRTDYPVWDVICCQEAKHNKWFDLSLTYPSQWNRQAALSITDLNHNTFHTNNVMKITVHYRRENHYHMGNRYYIFVIIIAINTMRPEQNGWHFTDNIFKLIFLNENIGVLIIILLKFVPKGPIDNKSALVQVMAWHQTGVKPFTEPILIKI